jgi:putative tryptophan/tyrosine transport system substrate-binding protein
VRQREFITLIGGATGLWPLGAGAQQSERVERIAVLQNPAEKDPESVERHAAFEQALQELGWSKGRVEIEYRWAAGDAESVRKYAMELVGLKPDVILASGSITVAPLLQATRMIPIVFAQVVDPVGAGFVDSLAHPGGNVTGFTQFEYSLSGKWLELLKEVAPDVSRSFDRQGARDYGASIATRPGRRGDRIGPIQSTCMLRMLRSGPGTAQTIQRDASGRAAI